MTVSELRRRRGPRRTLARWIGIILAVALAGTGIAVFVIYQRDASATCMNRGATIVVHEGANGECIGVSDGSYDFAPALAPVDRLIAAENKRVLDSGTAYVSVAYVAAMTIGNTTITSVTNLKHSIEGTYAAQYYANHLNPDGPAPLIRLLLVNDGSGADEWQPAVRDIITDVSAQHVVAVTGLGQSLATTKHAAETLSAAGIPMVGATISADDFDNIRGLVRVAAPNKEEAAAAFQYMEQRLHPKTAMLIEDVNKADSYAETLAAQFSADDTSDRKLRVLHPEAYDTGLPYGVYSNTISQMSADICLARPDVILFAGRGRDLVTLIQSMGSRLCSAQPFTIISGDDANQAVARADLQAALRSGITVYYTGIANPHEWSGSVPAGVSSGGDALDAFEKVFTAAFPGQPLDDGQAMTGYDAARTAIKAIRLVWPQASATAVSGELSALHGPRAVPGAGGFLDYYGLYNQGDGSNPVGKAIPILQIQPAGGIGFVMLTWPGGYPPPSS